MTFTGGCRKANSKNTRGDQRRKIFFGHQVFFKWRHPRRRLGFGKARISTGTRRSVAKQRRVTRSCKEKVRILSTRGGISQKKKSLVKLNWSEWKRVKSAVLPVRGVLAWGDVLLGKIIRLNLKGYQIKIERQRTRMTGSKGDFQAGEVRGQEIAFGVMHRGGRGRLHGCKEPDGGGGGDRSAAGDSSLRISREELFSNRTRYSSKWTFSEKKKGKEHSSADSI